MKTLRDRCALGGAALLVSAPALLPYHAEPLLAFYQDWIAFILGFAAALPILWPQKNETAPVPPLAIGLFALAAVVAVQPAFCNIAYVETNATGVLYIAWAALMVMAGARIREIFGIERVADVLQRAWACGGFALAVTGFMQFYHITVAQMSILTAFGLGQGMAGVIGQPNYLANILSCALASLLVLVANRRAHVAIGALAAAPIIVALALSGSRSAWVFMAAMVLCAMFARQRRLLAAAAAACAVFIAVNMAIAGAVIELPAANTTTGVMKITQSLAAHSVDAPRKTLALYGLHLFAGHPLLGVGWGEFTWNSFMAAPELGVNASVVLDRHAHNLLLQLLAETGVIGALCVFVPLVAWAWWTISLGARAWRDPAGSRLNLAMTWMGTIAAIHAAQAMLEMPHWYGYMLGPFALVLGLGAPAALQVSFPGWTRVAPRIVLAASLAVASVRLADYMQLEDWTREAMASIHAQRPLTRRLVAKLEQLHATVFAPEVEFIMAQIVSGGDVAGRLALNARALHIFPLQLLLNDRIELLRSTGANDEADAIERSADAVWPKR